MITAKVLSIDEAYAAVSWGTIFLLGSLIPLGKAMQNTGTAEWIIFHVLRVIEGWPEIGLQTGLTVLAATFSTVMSNVGAAILLVPLAISLALAIGADPTIFALIVAISTSNSFLIPTHQVNAMILGPGGYQVADFLKAGSIMSILFLCVSLIMINLMY